MGVNRYYANTLYDWLSQFGNVFREPIHFDAENPAPNEYITYSCSLARFGEEFMQPITLYSKSTGYGKLMSIVDDIEDTIGESGIIVKNAWGNITICKGSPFYQDKTDEDDSIRAGYVNLLITIYQKEV